ncbi:hypothetical protein EDD15DRAFT_2363639 [Pisolithus albus]|nr:hypothetical protein EDD15DRAFT_2363639 [Pisolithus albus]
MSSPHHQRHPHQQQQQQQQQHVSHSDFRLPPLKSLNFQYKSQPQDQDYQVNQDTPVNGTSYPSYRYDEPWNAVGQPVPRPAPVVAPDAQTRAYPNASYHQKHRAPPPHSPYPQPYPPPSYQQPSHTPSASTSASYTSYNASPSYPTYSNATSPTYPTPSAYNSHQYSTPTSAYPPPPSPTPTPTQPVHSHSPAHYVPAYPFEDARSVPPDPRYVFSSLSILEPLPLTPISQAMHAHPSLNRSLDNAIHTRIRMHEHKTSFDNHMRRLHLHLQTLAHRIPPTSGRTPNTTPVRYTLTTTWTLLVQALRIHNRLSPRLLLARLTSQRHLRDTHIPKIPAPTSYPPDSRAAPGTGTYSDTGAQSYTATEQGRPSYIPSEAQRPGPSYAPPEQQRTTPYGAGDHRTSYPDARAPTYAPSPSTTAGTSTSGGRPTAYVSDPGPVTITAPPPTAGPPARAPAIPHATMHYPPSHTLAYAITSPSGESHDAGRATGMPPPPAGPPVHGHPHSHTYGPPQVPSTHPSHSSAPPPPPPPHAHPQAHPHLQPPSSGPVHPSPAHPHGSQPPHQQQQQQPPPPPQNQPPSHPQVPPSSTHPHAPPHPQPQPTAPVVEPPRPAYVSPADTMHSRAPRYAHGHGHAIGGHVPPSGSTHAGQVADQGLASPQGQAQAYGSAASFEDRERVERERARERDRDRAIRQREEQREREREREEQKEREQREREKAREAAEKAREMEMQQQRERDERAKDYEKEKLMLEALEHCKVLYDFASRYAHMQTSSPHVQPTPQELEEMSRRASEVIRLLESLKSSSSTITSSTPTSTTLTGGECAGPSSASMDADTRPPKRPWEEMQTQQQATHSGSFPSAPVGNAPGPSTSAERTAAEKDMELIRTKRAMTTSLAATAAAGGGSSGGGTPLASGNSTSKNKYRKRSRATPPGKCHSCNIRETPEWRRGPDGARTLCNACGLRECLSVLSPSSFSSSAPYVFHLGHMFSPACALPLGADLPASLMNLTVNTSDYAKLVRKREKAAAEGGNSGMQIDIDMLRASARAVESEKSRPPGSGSASGGGNGGGGASGSDTTEMTAHTGSFQIMNVSVTPDNNGSSSSTTQTQTPTPTHVSSGQQSSPSHHPQQPPQATASGAPPPPSQQQPPQSSTTHTPQIPHTPMPHSATHSLSLPPPSHALSSPHGQQQHSSPHVHHPQVPSQHGHACSRRSSWTDAPTTSDMAHWKRVSAGYGAAAATTSTRTPVLHAGVAFGV